ncbi:MAG: hypothetical protein OXE99_03605, partial [Cellvibrionales bacterium]|nr:hypothetical protein [Cellvibrionales bacterium]
TLKFSAEPQNQLLEMPLRVLLKIAFSFCQKALFWLSASILFAKIARDNTKPTKQPKAVYCNDGEEANFASFYFSL